MASRKLNSNIKCIGNRTPGETTLAMEPDMREVMVLTKSRKGRVLAQKLVFFGLSLAQSSDDWKEALREEHEYLWKVIPIHRVNRQKRQVFLRNEQRRTEMIHQAKEHRKRDWTGREMIRRRCIYPVQTVFDQLNKEGKIKVRMLIMTLASRNVFPHWNGLTPLYRDVLTGREMVTEWFRFPWQTVVLIIQFYIPILLREQHQEEFMRREQRRIDNAEFCRQEQEWWQTSGHVCRCAYDDYNGFWERDCSCYWDHLQDLHWGEVEHDRFMVYCLDEDWDFQNDFPDGDTGEESRNKIGRDRIKAQKRKSRHRLPDKFRARGGRSGKHRHLEQSDR